MPTKPVEPQPSRRSEPAAEEANRTPGPPHEHTGPVSVTRHAKDDGRALILYTHAEPDAP